MRCCAAAMALALTLVVPAGLAEAQVQPRGERPQAEVGQDRRAELERQVRQRFLAQATQRLRLDAAQRTRLEEVLRRGAGERRALAQESRQLRMELVGAVQDLATPTTRYQQLLDRMDALRAREQALEQREAAALAEFLDPRQQAEFLVLRMQLNERVRGMGPGPRPGQRRPQRP
jgi:hypothetical protein